MPGWSYNWRDKETRTKIIRDFFPVRQWAEATWRLKSRVWPNQQGTFWKPSCGTKLGERRPKWNLLFLPPFIVWSIEEAGCLKPSPSLTVHTSITWSTEQSVTHRKQILPPSISGVLLLAPLHLQHSLLPWCLSVSCLHCHSELLWLPSILGTVQEGHRPLSMLWFCDFIHTFP